MRTLRLGINGFGRIGRCVHRIARASPGVEVVGINDLADPGELAYITKFDSVRGRAADEVALVEADGGTSLRVGADRVPLTRVREPAQIPWARWGAQVVIDATGAFRMRDQAAGHLVGGAERVIISAPSADADAMFVVGVNDHTYDARRHTVVSNASCTTNCICPVAKVLLESFGVDSMMITTVHAYTTSQAILDVPMKDRRRGRGGALSIIPTTTGAAGACATILPALRGRIEGLALRVPVPAGSITDIVARLARDSDLDEVHAALRAAAAGPMRGVLSVSDDELVSADIVGDPHSAIVDSRCTTMAGARDLKILAWYDNEWGYASRLVDLARVIATP